MKSLLSGSPSPTDFTDHRVREAWSAIVPAVLVLCFSARALPVPRFANPLIQWLTVPLRPWMPLREANALANPEGKASETNASVLEKMPLWRTLLFTGCAVVETLGWVALAIYRAVADTPNAADISWPVLMAFTWLYIATRRPSATPLYDVLILYAVYIAAGVLLLGGVVFEADIYKALLPSPLAMAGLVANLVISVFLFSLMLQAPLALPDEHVNPEEIGDTVTTENYTTLWRWISYQWIYPLVKKGHSTTLKAEDIWPLSTTMQSRPVFTKFRTVMRSTLWRRILAANCQDFIIDFTLRHVVITLSFAGPFFLNRILAIIDKSSQTREERACAYIFAALTMLAALLRSQAVQLELWHNRRGQTRIRTELIAAIYEKALRRRDLSGAVNPNKDEDVAEDTGKAGADIGKVVNLMSSDVETFTMAMSFFNDVYGAPYEIVVAITFLYQLLGWASLVGVLCTMATWPANSLLMKRIRSTSQRLSDARDKRVAVVNELLSSIKFIKFFAWEARWTARVLKARESEISWMIQSRINRVALTFIWALGPLFVNFAAFLVFVWQGNQLTIPVAFTSIALFAMLKEPLNMIPSLTTFIIDAFVGLHRIEAYLNEEDVDDEVSILKRGGSGQNNSRLDKGKFGIENGTFIWNSTAKTGTSGLGASKSSPTGNDSTPTAADRGSGDERAGYRFELKNINVNFPTGELTIVTGPVASGKSALLLALLGEMTQISGALNLYKDPSKVDDNGLMYAISYAAQTPWLRHQSIKDNILFGYPYDERRYRDVVGACALLQDFEQLDDGDLTEIGARGVTLSGGQKARVSLARAVYARTRIVLLDDPLSAVDSHTARILFEKLLKGPLLAKRTVVLITHHVELVLPGAYYLVKMAKGSVETQGTVKDLRSQGALDLIARESEARARESQFEHPADEAEKLKDLVDSGHPAASAKKPAQLVQDEHQEEGSVKWAIYKTYLQASSWWTWTTIAILIILQEVLALGIKLWMKVWGDAADASTSALSELWSPTFHESSMLYRIGDAPKTVSSGSATSLPQSSEHPFFYVGVYAALSIAAVLATTLLRVTLFIGGVRASRILFKKLLDAVVSATFRWHDVTPQGRILNRFSNDMTNIDMSLAPAMLDVNYSVAAFAASALIIIVIFPAFLFPAVVISAAYQQIAVRYLRTARDIQRMENNSKSPVISGFTELLEGIVTVRAFCAERRFLELLYIKLDETTKMWYTFWQVNRWLLVNFDALSAIAVFVTTIFALTGYVSSGLAAICITSAMSFTDNLHSTSEVWTSLELELNSVERVVEYLDLPQEAQAVVQSSRPPAYWPSSSNPSALISVRNLEIRYAPELPAVVKNVSFDLKSKEHIGILGRTGSGKSTLAMSLLRFTEPTCGSILIDGIDISTIGLQDLRSRLTFIPQDATLFSGTLRENIDPFGEHEDGECMDVLRRVHLVIEGDELSHEVSRISSRTTSARHGARDETGVSLLTIDVQDDVGSVDGTTIGEHETQSSISLNTQVSAGGLNISLGQRQLVSMARALLRRSTIIILDEATNSIDLATDAKIQATIREEFDDALLLTVAHRISTVIDYDRLIIMNHGEIAEFDTPVNLIEKQDGLFHSMCQQSGMFEELKSAARTKAKPP